MTVPIEPSVWRSLVWRVTKRTFDAADSFVIEAALVSLQPDLTVCTQSRLLRN